MMSYALLDAFTRRDRRDAIARVKTAIAEADGVIVDFAFYPTAIRVSVELEAGAMAGLCSALEACDLHLFEAAAPASGTSLVVAMLHVTLVPLAEQDSAA